MSIALEGSLQQIEQNPILDYLTLHRNRNASGRKEAYFKRSSLKAERRLYYHEALADPQVLATVFEVLQHPWKTQDVYALPSEKVFNFLLHISGLICDYFKSGPAQSSVITETVYRNALKLHTLLVESNKDHWKNTRDTSRFSRVQKSLARNGGKKWQENYFKTQEKLQDHFTLIPIVSNPEIVTSLTNLQAALGLPERTWEDLDSVPQNVKINSRTSTLERSKSVRRLQYPSVKAFLRASHKPNTDLSKLTEVRNTIQASKVLGAMELSRRLEAKNQDLGRKLSQWAQVPDVMKRGAHTLILVRNIDGKFVLGCKKIYPEGISRMVGGGIENGEKPIEGAARELHEELGVQVLATELQPLATVVAHISAENINLSFTTYLYFHQLKSTDIKPASDLDGLASLTEVELKNLIAGYELLPIAVDPNLDFSWFDYGQLYGPLHQIALEKYIELP